MVKVVQMSVAPFVQYRRRYACCANECQKGIRFVTSQMFFVKVEEVDSRNVWGCFSYRLSLKHEATCRIREAKFKSDMGFVQATLQGAVNKGTGRD